MSSNEMTTTQQLMPAPFGPGARQQVGALATINAGAVAIEQERAVAEAKGQMQLAKMFPRDLNAAYAELMEACKLPALANVAFYSVPQGGQKVTGPSIRLAEQIAACVGNFEFGHRELSRVEATATSFGRSEIEVYAWDKEKNNRSIRQITVLHVLDTREGPRKLRDQKDIDNKIANVASKQARGRILALLPKWLVEAAIEECKKTLGGNNDQPLSVRVRAMTQAFAKFGVTTEHLEKYLGHKLDETLADELVDLTGVFNAIKEGAAPSEFFGEQQAEEKPSAAAETAKKGAAQRATKGAQSQTQTQGQQTQGQDQAAAAPAAEPEPAAKDPAPVTTDTAQEPAATQSNSGQKKSKPVNEPDQAPASQDAPQSGTTQQTPTDDAGDYF